MPSSSRSIPLPFSAELSRPTSAPPVVVVGDGAATWRIVVAPGAGRVERFAAAELKKYVLQMTGVAITEGDDAGGGDRGDAGDPIDHTDQVDRIGGGEGGGSGERGGRDGAHPVILLGVRSDLADTQLHLPAPKPGFDGYAISIAPGRIVLAGDNPRGVLYAVYDLLERAGCRWWHPALDPNDPEVVPKRSELRFAPGPVSESGRVELRVYNGSAFFNEIDGAAILPQIDWAAKNRFNCVSWQASARPEGGPRRGMEQMRDCGALDALDDRGLWLHGPCHSFPFFLPTERYFDAHPEWFGLCNGKRESHGGTTWPLVNYCWSNDEANAEFIRNVEAYLKEWPQIKILNPVWIDGGIVCQCPKCAARGGANLLIDLFNRISESLETSAPGVFVEAVVGYPPVEAPPTAAVANGKWGGLHAHWGRNNRSSYDDPDYSRRANLLTWKSYFPRFQECSYYAAASHQPFNGTPFLHALEGDTRFIVKQGITGQYVLQYPHGFWWNFSFSLGEAGMFAYYFPDRAPREQLRNYAMTYYGATAGPIVAEYLWMLGANENLEKSYRACRSESTDGEMEWFRGMEELRLRAATLAEGDPVTSYRVGKLGAANRFLLTWGNARRKVVEAERAFKDREAGTVGAVDAAVVRALVAEARQPLDGLMTLAASIEKEFPGTLTAEWLESWYLTRTFRGPLDVIEKKLDGGGTIQPSAKPAHVAGPD